MKSSYQKRPRSVSSAECVFASRVGLGRRSLAFMLDIAILAFPLLLFGGGMWMSMFSHVIPFIGLTAVIAAYIGFECICRASPGKMIMGMAVGHTTGQHAPRIVILTRSMLKLSWALIPVTIEWVDIADTYILFDRGWSLKHPTDWFLPYCFSMGMMLVAMPMLLGVLTAFGKSRQTLYDRLTRTAVYDLPRDTHRPGFPVLVEHKNGR